MASVIRPPGPGSSFSITNRNTTSDTSRDRRPRLMSAS